MMQDTPAPNTPQTSNQTSAGGMFGVIADVYILTYVFIFGFLIADLNGWLPAFEFIPLLGINFESITSFNSVTHIAIWSTPIAGILFIYRSIALKRVKVGLAVLNPLRDRMNFPMLSGVLFVAALYVTYLNLWLSGLMFLLGFLVATGAGQALKVVGLNRVRANHHRFFTVLSCLVLLLSSWLGQGSTLVFDEIVLSGALIAPLAGMIAGFFLPVEIDA